MPEIHKVLVGEHEAATRKSVIDALEKQNYQPVIAYDSDQLMDILKTGRFNFILLNLFLPGQNGMKTISQVRSLEGYADALVVAMAPANRRSDLSAAVSSGATDYLTKPIDAQDLQQILERHRKKLPPAQEDPS